MGRRFFGALLACAAALLAAPALAGATTQASVVGDTIEIDGGPEDNSIELGYVLIASDVAIRDDAGVSGTPTCPTVSGEIRCPVEGVNRIHAAAAGGDDSLDFAVAYVNFVGPLLRVDFTGGAGDDIFAALGRGRLDGGPGSDRLTGGSEGDDPGNVILGGSGNDFLRDDEGNDTLNGGRGRDRLNGGDDRDRYVGGGGRDVVLAKDFTKDLRINCGAGNDRLRRDPFDPRPRSC